MTKDEMENKSRAFIILTNYNENIIKLLKSFY